MTDEIIRTLDIAVLSPGIPTDVDFVNRMRNAGVLIWGELELADQFAKGTVLAITGTNGKTTTTTLVGEILKNYYSEVHVVGKMCIRDRNPCECPPNFPTCVCGKKSLGKVVTRKPILPSEEELEMNPRSKSAKLRVFERR